MTSLDIADRIGIQQKNVSDALYNWHVRNYGYVKRLKEKRGRFYQYEIGKHGVKAYMQYDSRFKKGFSLNQKSAHPQKMDSVLNYFGINKIGEELGYLQNDIPHLAGLKKRDLS